MLSPATIIAISHKMGYDIIHINSWKYGEELGGGMFQTIDIKAYRGLKNITLQNLSRVNILVGENNTGKTST